MLRRRSWSTPLYVTSWGEIVLKRVLQVRKEPCRVKKFSSLQIVQETAKLALRQPTNCMQEGERCIMSNHRRLVQQALLGGGQRVDTRSEDRLHRRRDLGAGERPGKPIATAYDYDDGSIH
jgi:hypothetical protein